MLGKHFSGRCRRREVAFVKRFKQESMYGLSAKKVAVVERWPLIMEGFDSIILKWCPIPKS